MAPKKKATSGLSAEVYLKNLKKFAESKQDSKACFDNSDLEKFSLHNPVVITGGEAFRAKRIVSLTNEILFPNEPSRSARTYFAADLGNQGILSSLLNQARGGDLFSKASCIALYDTETLRVASIDKLLPILTLNKSEIFFLIVATGKANKLVDALEENCLQVAILNLQGEQLGKWIAKELERLGHLAGIDGAAINCLARSFGEDASRLSTELSKLALLVSQNKTISVSDVEELLLQKAEHNSFTLLECVAEKKPGLALQIFESLTEQGMHPLQILALISKSVRSLYASYGNPTSKLHADISNLWFIKNIPKSKKLFSQKDLAYSIELTAKLDNELKGSRRVPEDLVRDFIVKMAGR
jgi:DNA polymerase III delta subunit